MFTQRGRRNVFFFRGYRASLQEQVSKFDVQPQGSTQQGEAITVYACKWSLFWLKSWANHLIIQSHVYMKENDDHENSQTKKHISSTTED